MRKTSTLLLVALAAVCSLALLPGAAQAVSMRPDCSKKLLHAANHHRAIVIKKHGKRAPGRDIVKWGRIGPNQRPHPVRDCDIVRKYRDQLKQLHAPQQLPGLVTTAVDPARPPAGVQTPGVDGAYNGYSIPEYIVECESGGDYNASNPSGAYGAYQIMPGTAAAYGCDLSTPAGQDQCAARIYAAEGASPWVCG